MNELPPGFVLDSQPQGLPPGFVLDAPAAKPKPVGAAMVQESPRLEPGPRTATMPDLQPSWGEVAGSAVMNLPRSLWRDVAVPTYEAVTQRPVETLSAIPRVIVGAIESLPQPRGHEQRRAELAKTRPQFVNALRESQEMASAVGQDFVDAYGSEGAIKNTLANHPGRVLMDVSTVGTAGAALPGKAGQVASVVSKIDPLTMAGNALKYGAAKPAEVAGANVLGRTTGAGAESIRAAGRAGREGGDLAASFTDNMRGNVPVEQIVDRAKSALDQVRQDRAQAYKAGMADVTKNQQALDFGPIEDALNKASEVGSYKGVTVNRSAGKTMDDISAIVNEWKAYDPAEFHTIEGLDALKRTIGDLRDSTEAGTPARVAADRVYNAVRGVIKEADPKYGAVMDEYAKASQGIKEATKTFSLTETATSDTAARKLLSATRNNVQTNYGERQRVLNALAEYDPGLPSAIAGQALNSLPPRGIIANAGAIAGAYGIAPAVMANPLNALSLAAFSPRIVGETVYFGGKAVGAIDEVANALGITAGRLRALAQGSYQSGRPEDIRQRAMSLRETNALAAP